MGWWAIHTPLDPSTVDMARFSWTMGSTPATAVHGDDLFSLADGVVRREVLTDGKNSIIYKGDCWSCPRTCTPAAPGSPPERSSS